MDGEFFEEQSVVGADRQELNGLVAVIYAFSILVHRTGSLSFV